MNKLTLIGIIIAGIGNIIGLLLIHRGNAKEAITKNKSLSSKLEYQKEQMKLLNKTNNSLERKVDELSEQAITQKGDISRLSEDNHKLSNKLLTAQSDIISKFIGDDNYGVIDISAIICGNKFCYQLTFSNISENPIYDVQIRYYNVEQSDATKINGIATIETLDAHITKNIGNVSPNLSTPISKPKIISDRGEHYIFYIGARNGIYYQESFLFPSKNGLVASVDRIMKYNFNEKKYQEIRRPYHHPDDFPIKRENVKWRLNFDE